MSSWWQWLSSRAGRRDLAAEGRSIPDALWIDTLARYPFLQPLSTADRAGLRSLVARFLTQKQFHGAAGVEISDPMAVAIAAQACLPLVHIDAGQGHAASQRRSALDWYGDFVGIVVQPGEVLAQREVVDDSGIVHRYREVIAGEAMDQGPIMLSWTDVAAAGAMAHEGYNVVIHEFMHKFDLCDGVADGCPALSTGFLGARSARDARQQWFAAWEPAYQAFREQVIIADRFGGQPTWLDPYGAESLSEFFAVACEAFFVNRMRFTQEFGTLVPLLDAFFGTAGDAAEPVP